MARSVDVADLDDIALGAAVLGAGGGGDPYVGKLLARDSIERHGPVTLVAPDEVPDDARVVAIGMIGAPTIVSEKLPYFPGCTSQIALVTEGPRSLAS